MNVIEQFMKSSLVIQVPGCVPIFTEDGSLVKNPAVGYSHLLSSPICYNNPKGLLGAACSDSHGANSLTTLDNE